jgi:hypothetical protein
MALQGKKHEIMISASQHRNKFEPTYGIMKDVGINTIVSDPKKGVCADPVDGGAILGRGGTDPHSRDRERQLAPDKGRGKT